MQQARGRQSRPGLRHRRGLQACAGSCKGRAVPHGFTWSGILCLSLSHLATGGRLGPVHHDRHAWHPINRPQAARVSSRAGGQKDLPQPPSHRCSAWTHDHTRLHSPTLRLCSVAAALDRSTPGRVGMLCPIEPSDNALHNCASGLICVPLPHVRAGLGQGRGVGLLSWQLVLRGLAPWMLCRDKQVSVGLPSACAHLQLNATQAFVNLDLP